MKIQEQRRFNLASLFGGKRKTQQTFPATRGRSLYAVGDIHGRDDLLARIIQHLRNELQTVHGAPKPLLVFVGDYVDRGTGSRQVVDQILELVATDDFEVRPLLGNHDKMLLDFLETPAEIGPAWMNIGGGPTLASYGVAPPAEQSDEETWIRTRDAFAQALPAAHLGFFRGLARYRLEGDYLFVHAGVRPGLPLDEQTDHDLLWIRDTFLNSTRPSGYVVVHGHTPAPEVQASNLRIGIDTGAYATGVLSAIRVRDGALASFATRP